MFNNFLTHLFLFIFLFLSSSVYSNPPNSTEDLLYTTLRITCKTTVKTGAVATEQTKVGTGYIYDFLERAPNTSTHTLLQTPPFVKKPYLVTNKHVIDNVQIGELTFNISQNNISPEEKFPIRIGQFLPQETPFSEMFIRHPSVDLCAYSLSGAVRYVEDQLGTEAHSKYKEEYNKYQTDYTALLTSHKQSYGAPFLAPPIKPLEKKVFYRSLSRENLVDFQTEEAIQDIMMVGYPMGIADEENNLPVVRKGITSSHIRSNFQKKPEVLIDAAVFPGSSGSPVFLCQHQGSNFFKAKLLGTAYAIPQYTAQGIVCDSSDHMQCTPIPTISTSTKIPSNLGFVIKATELSQLQTLILK